MFSRLAALLAGAALVAVPTTLRAQGTPIQAGTMVHGTLAAGDATLSSGEYMDAYTFAGRAGQRVHVKMHSTTFDSFLMMRGPSDFSQQNDDEVTGNSDAGLDVRLPADGTYRIIATSYRPGEQGDYDIEVQEGAGAVAAAPLNTPVATTASGGGTITAGQTVRGTLASGDQTLSSGEFADRFVFQGRRGQHITVRLASNDFDPYLLARGPGGLSQDNDDDATERGSHNSRLDLTLPQDGNYTITATTYRPSEQGTYTLSLTDDATTQAAAAAQPAAPRATGLIALGQTLSGRLEQGDPQLRSGEFVDAYRFQGTRGQRLEIRLNSTEFDPYVQITGPNSFSQFNDDDVDGGTSNSHLIVTLPEDAVYQISATSYRAGEAGSYQLTVSATTTVSAGSGSSVASARLTMGQAADFSLSAGDDTLASGEYVDRFSFQGQSGQRIAIDMSSTAFDTYVQLISPAGHQEENDDAAQGTTNSRIETVLTETGTYTVLATSYRRGLTGAYRVTLGSLAAGARALASAATPGQPVAAAAAAASSSSVGTTENGRLQQGDATLQSGEFVDRYTFQGRRGQTVTVEMNSTEIDPYLVVVGPGGVQQENDDATTSSRNARVVWPLPADGLYTVNATTYRPGESGAYTLRIATGAAPAPVANVAGRAAGAASRQRVFAVLVGISDYAGVANNLPYTADDARKMAESLRRAGVLAEQSVVLVDAEATYDRVHSAFMQVAAAAGPDDVFLFFYSGHGTQTRENPQNTSEPDLKDEAIVLRDRLVIDDEMAQWFRAVHSRMAIIALDACFSGGFARDVVNRPGVMGFFSSEEDLTSAVAGKFQAGGYLSHFLRAGLSGEADADHNGSVTAGELSAYVHHQFNTEAADVESVTQDRQHNYQFPVIERGGVKIDDIVLALQR